MSTKHTDIKSLGEFGLIDHLAKRIGKRHPTTVLGIGDDAAIAQLDGQQQTLMTSDMLVEGIHFDLSFQPLHHLGFKAVAVNVSDIAAMNGLPTQVLVNLGLSSRFTVEAIDALYKGMEAACEAYGCDLAGGDMTSSPMGLVLGISVTGQAPAEQVVRRSGAKAGEVICATGDLGGAFLGLKVLQREKEVFKANPDMQPQLEDYSYVVARQLRAEARTDIVHDLREKGVVPTSMMDISDGLASELLHIRKASQVGVAIYENQLPVAENTLKTAADFKIAAATAALNGGEDYELVFTVTQEDYKKIEKHPDISAIGITRAYSEGALLITTDQEGIQLEAQGWKHF